MPICSSNIQVSVRVRPFSNREQCSNSRIIVEVIDRTQINLYNPKLEGNQSLHDHRDRYKQFTFDHCYLSLNRQDPSYANQQIIFNDIGMDVLKSFLEGYNTCILCYGQTGTGKTFTMMGNTNSEEMGLTPKICENLFKRIEESNNESSTLCFKTLISYMEIYNEKLRDLFDFEAPKSNNLYNSTNSSSKNLKIREHPNKGIYVQNLNQFPVTDLTSTMRYLVKGNQNRSTASTHVHDKSSRSHAIFTITFIQAKVENEMPIEIISKLHLVDLAGSERASNDLIYNKKQLKEGSNINKSLVSLGNVISILADSSKKSNNVLSQSDFNLYKESTNTSDLKSSFVPYRDSLLTYLLKDSLGGNSKTHMIANISPASCCYHETLNTLLFAQRAKKIINKPKINEDPKTALIKELKEEIYRLKDMLTKTNNLYSMSHLNYDSSPMNNTMSGSQLELILEKNEAKAQELTLSWIDKWNQTKELSSSQTNSFLNSPSVKSQKFSSGFLLQPDLPHIVSIIDDRLSTGIMIFYIKDGVTVLGKDENSADIALNDKNLSESHCIFQNSDCIVTLTPIDNSLCVVNDIEIKGQTGLSQGDVIKVGKFRFRFNHPEEAAKLRENEQETLNKKFLKSQSLPSLARHTNEGLLMAKYVQKTNNSIKMEEFDSISRSSSFISSKSDYSTNIETKSNSINEIRNDIKHLNSIKMGEVNDETCNEINVINQIGILNNKFHSEQILCKKNYDQQLKDLNDKISKLNTTDFNSFDYENYFYSTDPQDIDYIHKFQLNSPLGQLKQKFNLELKFFMNLKQLRLTYVEELNILNQNIKSNNPIRLNVKQTTEELIIPVESSQGEHVLTPRSERKSKIFDYNDELNKDLDTSNLSSASCPVLNEITCFNCYHENILKRTKSTNDICTKIPASHSRLFNIYINELNSSSNRKKFNNYKNRVIIIRGRKKNILSSSTTTTKRNKSILKKPMKNTKQSILKRKLSNIKNFDCCQVRTKFSCKITSNSQLDSRICTSRAQSVESSNHNSKNLKLSKLNTKTIRAIDFDLHGHNHKHLFPFYFSYNLKDSDDDCLNKKTKNLFKTSMNRIDNTHATFLNCLRDWNDPFLHGHKPIKPYGCQRCEGCGCRSITSSSQSIHNCPSHETERHYLNDTHSKLNRNFLNRSEFLNGFQPIMRCRSSANVPKTIDQCIKLAKSRPRPSSIKANFCRKTTNETKKFNNSKVSTNSIESDKDSNDTLSKDDDFKILFQTSSPDSSMSQISKGTNEINNNEELLNKDMNKTEVDQNSLNHDFVMDKQKHDDYYDEEKQEICLNETNNKTNSINSDNLVNLLSSSTSSMLDNDDIVYDDSLRDDSFESDSLMVDSDTKQQAIQISDEKNVNNIIELDDKTNNKLNAQQIDQQNSIYYLTSTNQIIMSSKAELFDSIIGESINESGNDNGCKHHKLNPIQKGYKEAKKRRKSLNDSIEDINCLDNKNLLKKPSPNRSYSESYLNDTDIDQDLDCSNSDDLSLKVMELEDKKLTRNLSFEKYKLLERQPNSPVNELEDQMKFYERVKETFFVQLDKSMSQSKLSPTSSSSPSPRRRSTSSEQKYLSQSSNNSDQEKSDTRIVFSGDSVGGEKSSRSSSRSSSFSKKSTDELPHEIITQLDVPKIVVHETENEKSINEDSLNSNHDNDEILEKISIHQDEIQLEKITLSSSKTFQPDVEQLKKRRNSFKLSHRETSFDESGNEPKKTRKLKFPSFFSSFSPVKKRPKMNDHWSSKPHSRELTKSIETNNLKNFLQDELKSYEKQDEDDDDEFFLAISSSRLQTGSCPEFYWYPPTFSTSNNLMTSVIKKKRTKSENDLIISASKSFENITQTNYVQMINSMINGAISDVADPEYVDYLKRHIAGLFDNFTPVLMKSKSNEEIAIASPSRDKISDLINQTMPKSFSFDFKFLEESKLNNSDDVMDFSKFGLGIKDHESSDESMESDELDKSFIETNEVEDLVCELIDKICAENESKTLNFELNELKSSTKINFDDLEETQTKLSQQNSMNDDSTPFGSESYASTVVLKKEESPDSSTESPSSASQFVNSPVNLANDQPGDINLPPQDNQDSNVNLINISDSEDEFDDERGSIRRDSNSDSDPSEDPEDEKQKIIVEDLDDLIIECKVNYKVKTESDPDSSFTDSDESSESDKKSSDYDNLKPTRLRSSSSNSLADDTENTALLSTSVHSLNSVDSVQSNHMVNETLASFTSMTSNDMNKSLDEEEEQDYNFVDDFTDLSKELDYEEDDFCFTGVLPRANPILAPRLLDPIEEEDDTEAKKEQKEDNDFNIKHTEDMKNMFGSVEQFVVSFDYKFKSDIDKKLRTQDCNIDSLLGSTTPTVFAPDNLVSTRIDDNLTSDSEESVKEEESEEKDLILEVETKYGGNSESDTSSNEDNNETLTEKFEVKSNNINLEVETKYTEEIQKDTALEVEAKNTPDSSFKDDEMNQTLTEKCEDISKDDKLEPVSGEEIKPVEEIQRDSEIKFEDSSSETESSEEIEKVEENSNNIYLEVETIYTEEIQKDCLFEVETKNTSDSSFKDDEMNQTLIEKNEEISKDDKLEPDEEIKPVEETQRDSVIESKYEDSSSESESSEEIEKFEELTEKYEEIQKDSLLEVETRYDENFNTSGSDDDFKDLKDETVIHKVLEIEANYNVSDDSLSEESSNDEDLNKTEKNEQLLEAYEEIQSNSHLEVEAVYKPEDSFGSDSSSKQEDTVLLNEKPEDLTQVYEEKDENLNLQVATEYTQEPKKEEDVSDEEEVHVEYFEYVISKDMMLDKEDTQKPETKSDTFQHIETQVDYELIPDGDVIKKAESELDLSKFKLDINEDDSFTSDKLKEVLSDIEKEIEDKSPEILSPRDEEIKRDELSLIEVNLDENKSSDKSYQVNPGDLALNMVDSHTQSTPPVSPVKKFAPLKKNAATETEESEIFSNYLIINEEQKLRKKLQEKENSLKLTTIATQTENEKILVENLEAKENIPVTRTMSCAERVFGDKSNVQKILIVNDENNETTNLKLNIRQKIKIQNLDSFIAKTNADQLAKVTDEFYNLPNQIKTTHLKSVDIQTDPEVKKEPRSRSVSNSSTFIDLLSLNLDRSKTWVELTEAKLNYMIGETDAVLRSMNLDSSDDETKKTRVKNITIETNEENSTPRTQGRLNSSSRMNTSFNSPRINLISPDHNQSCLTSTNKTIEEMTQVYLDNYKRQLEDSRKELHIRMSMLEMEKDKISKIRDVRKRELYMRRQAAIEAFRLERERELRNSQTEELIHNESVVYDDFDDDDLNRTFRNSKRVVSDLPSKNREKLAKIRRDLLINSSGVHEDLSSPRVGVSTPRIEHTEDKVTRRYKNVEYTKRPDSRLLIPVQKTFIEETTETRIEHTTSSSSNSSSIIDESRLLLKEYEQLRSDSVSEIQRAHDSLNASLVWLENQKLNRLRSLQENKTPRDNVFSYSTSKPPNVPRLRTEEVPNPTKGRTSSRTDSTSSYKSTKTRELSPVSRFREEQKEYLLRVNTSNSSTSNSNPNRKEIPISIYSPLSSSSFLSSPSTNFAKRASNNTPSTNNKTRIDQMSKQNVTTTITITDYTAKIPSNQPTIQRIPLPPPLSQQKQPKYRYRPDSDSDEDKIC